MRPRHLLGIAALCGAMGTLGGQTAQAQAPSSPRFVQLLLTKESQLIKTNTKALNKRDNDILKLNIATNQRKINQLMKELTQLHRQILKATTSLQVLSGQVYTDAKGVPSSPSLLTRALANLVTVQGLSIRAGLGLNPVTPSS